MIFRVYRKREREREKERERVRGIKPLFLVHYLHSEREIILFLAFRLL